MSGELSLRVVVALTVLHSACGARTPLDVGAGGGTGTGTTGDGGRGAGAGNVGGSGGGGGPSVDEIVSLAVGGARSCVATESGLLRCWGLSEHGAAGYGQGVCQVPAEPCSDACCVGDDETPAASGIFVEVGGAVVDVRVATFHTCALLSTGRVRCWGSGGNGRLGHAIGEDVGDDEVPASLGDVDVGGEAIAIAVGGDGGDGHTCALLVDGRVRCWGSGSVGALGYGNTEDIGDDETPASAGDVDVGGPVSQIAAGDGFTCALLTTGSVRCWGFGARGRLGYGNTENIGDDETPAAAGDVDVGGRVVLLAAGGRHTCALLESGNLRCWGYGGDGDLGYGSTENIGDDETPASAGDVAIGGRVVGVSAAAQHTCAVLEGGALACWGSNVHGELGNPTLTRGCFGCGGDPLCCIGDDELPNAIGVVDVGGSVTKVAVGRFHVCALLDTGGVRCWGSGEYGALGYGNIETVGDDEYPSQVGDVAVF